MKKLVTISSISIIFLIVMISGCTSSSTTDPTQDIYLQTQNPPTDYMGGVRVPAWIASKSHKSYSNVTLLVTGLSNDGQIITEKKVYVDYLDNQYQSTGFFADLPRDVDHITIKVLNATAA